MLNPTDCMAFNAMSAQPLAVPNYFVDVTDAVELKVRAMDTLRSQNYEGTFARKATEAWAGFFGFNSRWASYIEAFMLDRPEIGEMIPVSQVMIDRANEPERNAMLRRSEIQTPFIKLPD